MVTRRPRFVLFTALVGLLTLYSVILRMYSEDGHGHSEEKRVSSSVEAIIEDGAEEYAENPPFEDAKEPAAVHKEDALNEATTKDLKSAVNGLDVAMDNTRIERDDFPNEADVEKDVVAKEQDKDSEKDLRDRDIENMIGKDGDASTLEEDKARNRARNRLPAFGFKAAHVPTEQVGWRTAFPEVVANPAERQDCLESSKRRPPLVRGASPLETLWARVRAKAEEANCLTSRTFVIWGAPHFTGGRDQYLRALRLRGWVKATTTTTTTTAATKAADAAAMAKDASLLPPRTALFIAACSRVFSVTPLLDRAPLVSKAAKERESTMKVTFFQAVAELFRSKQCGYTHFHPESVLVDSSASCRRFLARMMEETDDTQLWFLKTAKESFGKGITVRTNKEVLANELSRCDWFEPTFRDELKLETRKRILFQRGVERIFKVDGRVTHGRAYLLISSYAPASAWFMMGYFNVAQAAINTTALSLKEAHVTNLDSNHDSKRLLFKELGLTPKQAHRAYHNVKRAALTVFHALRPKVGGAIGSYSLMGFDYVLQDDMQVKVLETNCNCQLFNNPLGAGQERVNISVALMNGMIDAVILSRFAPEVFSSVLAEELSAGNYAGEDGAKSDKPLFEPIYSEAVVPAFEYDNIFDKCAFT